MLYDYQYTLAAIIGSLILLALFYLRRSYSSASNRVFTSLIYANLLASVLNIFTYFTISYPSNYTAFARYSSNIIYIILYGMVAATYMRYICTLIGEKKWIRFAKMMYFFIVVTEMILTVTTPWTGWIFRFDENLSYKHGPLFVILYIMPILAIFSAVLIHFTKRAFFSAYQRGSMLAVFFASLGLSMIQIFNPRADIFHLVCVFILFTIYIIYENPAVFTYHNTRCYNTRAFIEEIKKPAHQDADPDMLLFILRNRPRTHAIQQLILHRDMQDMAAELLHTTLGHHVYCISDGKFIIFSSSPTKQEEAATKIHKLFDDPLNVNGTLLAPDYRLIRFKLSDLKCSEDYIDHMIEALSAASPEKLDSVQTLIRIVEQQHSHRETEDILLSALKKDAFSVVYQPIYDLHDGLFHSAEALVRLEGELSHTLTPGTFIPIAEKNGSILAIGRLVFEKVCVFIESGALAAAGLSYIEVNVSPVQLMQKGMAEEFISIMEAHRVSPDFINLEITESAKLATDPNFIENMNALTRYGVTFAIDDYGTGFAAMDYLYRLPISIVKVDRSLLCEAMINENARLIFRNVMQLIHGLNKKIVVEGAENEEMIALIRENGGDMVQGYYYSRPSSKEDFIKCICTKNFK